MLLLLLEGGEARVQEGGEPSGEEQGRGWGIRHGGGIRLAVREKRAIGRKGERAKGRTGERAKKGGARREEGERKRSWRWRVIDWETKEKAARKKQAGADGPFLGRLGSVSRRAGGAAGRI